MSDKIRIAILHEVSKRLRTITLLGDDFTEQDYHDFVSHPDTIVLSDRIIEYQGWFITFDTDTPHFEKRLPPKDKPDASCVSSSSIG